MTSIQKLIKENGLEHIKGSPWFFEVKENENHIMVCFTDKSDLTLQETRESTGIIFDLDFNILHFSFDKCYEGFDNSGDPFTGQLGEYVVNMFFIGSLIKVFYCEKTGWNLSTSKNLEASNSRWSSKKSFDDLFEECIKVSYDMSYFDFIEKLDPNFCYTYIIQHPENKSLINVSTPLAFLLNKVNTTTLSEEIPDIEFFKIDNTIEELVSFDRKVNENYMVYQMKNGKVVNRIKMLSPEYLKFQEIYGNQPDIGLRYLEMLVSDLKNFTNNTVDFNNTRVLNEAFPEHTGVYNKIEVLYKKALVKIQKDYLGVFSTKTKKIDDFKSIRKNFLIKLHQNRNQNIPLVQDINIHLASLGDLRKLAYMICYTF
jgi:hypothetical protein